MFWAVLVLGIIATIVFLVIRVKTGGVPATIAKAIASVFFIATACVALGKDISKYKYGLLIIIGLVFGLLGDIWLDLKWVYPKHNDTYLYAGFYSFFVGHIFFITAIYLHYKWTVSTLLISLGIALVGAAITIAIEKPMKIDYNKFRKTCFMYGFILIMTTASALIAAITTGFSQPAWSAMTIGAVLFLLSDLVLSGTYFGEGKNTPAYVIVNHVLYYAAQFMIASSILLFK